MENEKNQDQDFKPSNPLWKRRVPTIQDYTGQLSLLINQAETVPIVVK